MGFVMVRKKVKIVLMPVPSAPWQLNLPGKRKKPGGKGCPRKPAQGQKPSQWLLWSGDVMVEGGETQPGKVLPLILPASLLTRTALLEKGRPCWLQNLRAL